MPDPTPPPPAESTSLRANDASDQGESVKTPEVLRPLFPDEEVDHDLDDLQAQLDNLNAQQVNHRETGALAYHAGLSPADVERPPKAIYDAAKEQIASAQNARIGTLRPRIDENRKKLDVLQPRLTKVEQEIGTTKEALSAARTSSSNACAAALRERLATIAQLARKDRAAPQAAGATPTPGGPVRPLYTLDEKLKSLPASQNEARIAYLWTRLLRYREEHEEARRLTAGLERSGVSYVGARFLVWSGFSILLGAGGAVGALLQESDIGQHILERLLGSIQYRLGFIRPSASGTAWDMVTNRDLLPGLGTGLGIILGFVLIILALLYGIGQVKEHIKITDTDDDEDPTPARASQAQTADSTPFTVGIIRVIVDGERSVLKVLPGLAIFALGVLFFLAIGPNFYGPGNTIAFSLTRTSVGVVFALAVAAIVQVLFIFSLFPGIRTRLLKDEPISVLSPRAAVVIVIVFVVVSSCVFAFGPVVQTTQPIVSASSGNMTPRVPQFPAHIVWFIATTGLLLSCSILSIGNIFRGVYLRAQWLEQKLFRLQVRLADKIKDPEPIQPLSSLGTTIDSDALGTTIDHKWRGDFNSDLVLKRIVLSGVFSADELAPVFDSYTAFAKCEAACDQLDAKLDQLRGERDQLIKEIYSREKSSNNYENRISRLQRQGAMMTIAIEQRYQDVCRQLREGYYISQTAYTPEPPPQATAHAAGN